MDIFMEEFLKAAARPLHPRCAICREEHVLLTEPVRTLDGEEWIYHERPSISGAAYCGPMVRDGAGDLIPRPLRTRYAIDGR